MTSNRTDEGRATDGGDEEWLISVDDHLFEPPDTWLSAAPASIRDRVPHLIEDDAGLAWLFEDVRVPIRGVEAQKGRPAGDISTDPMRMEDMLAAYWDPVARVDYLDRDHVLSSLCFPYFPRYCGQTFYEAEDRRLGWWCLQRYNDWVIDEWAGAAPGRYIPMIITPLWDPVLAAEEIERCAGKGAKAIAFSENPSRLGLPSIHDKDHWAPLFRAADETRLPIAIHFGSSSTVPTTSADAPMLVPAALAPLNLAFAFTDWIFSGILERHPNIKMLMSEGGIGWIPYMIQRCEVEMRAQPWMTRTDLDELSVGAFVNIRGLSHTMQRTPSELFHDQIYGCFIDDVFGCRHIDEIGVDNVLIETDFPHGDGSYPNSQQQALEQLSELSADDRRKVLRGNAERIFDIAPAVVGARPG